MKINNNFRTLEKLSCCEIIEKKSKFIGHIYPCETKDECLSILDNIKKIHKKSKHICFAYRILEKDLSIIEKFTDAKEPRGVAGIVMLESLRNDNLINCLAIVIRYYGGIKLGKSNLSKCYKNSIKECLNKSYYLSYIKIITYSINIDYKNINIINKIIKMRFIYKVEILNTTNISGDKQIYIQIEEKNYTKLNNFLKHQNIDNIKLVNTKTIKKRDKNE